MKLGALVAMTPALALGVVLLAPSAAEADHHRSSDRGRRSADGRSYRGHDRPHRQGYDRKHRKRASRGHQRPGRYDRYRYSYRPYRARRYYRPAPPVVYAPPPRYDAPPPVYYAPPPRYYGPRGGVYVAPRPYRGGVRGSVSVGLPYFGLYVRF